MAKTADNKKAPTKRPHKKASTGAWWKNLSTNTSEEIRPEEIKSQDSKSQDSLPASSSKTSSKKPSQKTSSSSSTASDQQQGEESPQSSALETKAPETKSAPEVTQPLADLPADNIPESAPGNVASQAKAQPEAKSEEPQPQSEQQPVEQLQTKEATPPSSKASSLKESVNRGRQARSKSKQHKQTNQKKTEEHTTSSSNSSGSSEEATVKTGKKSEPKHITTAKNIKLLINAEEPEECRIALLEDGRMESFHVSTVSGQRTKNNIYKGRIVSIEPNLQAAFVDLGTGRNGFLPFNEIHPEYFRQDVTEQNRKLIAQQQWKKLKIEEVVRKGQEVLVQVVKEVIGNKGANMTTYLSLPGRCLVLMPGSDSAGISRKITGEEQRSRLREIMNSFTIPEGLGYIIRTASAEITKTALQRDLRYLLKLWQEIYRRGQTMEAPALVYQEEEIIVRYLRDHFFAEIQEITVDTEESYKSVTDFVELLPAKQRKVKIKLHRGARPIFNQHNIEEQIESIFKPQVQLPSGGSIVINPTEALVAIDVNSGRTSKNSDFEETIFLANMEAAAELSRQLRLRDLGGLIVVDFIDMRNKKHIKEVEKQVKLSMKRDKAKVDISRISRFGLMQISRQKMGSPIEKANYHVCEYCQGRGTVKSVETIALFYLRRIQTGISRKKTSRVECQFPLVVAQYLLNKKRTELHELESKHDAQVEVIPRPDMKPTEHQIDFF